jgi:uncharacterized membrane protein YbhN (UPF0104 family)
MRGLMLAAAVVAVIAVALTTSIDWRHLGSTLASGSPELLALAVVLNVLSGVCKGVAWHGLVDALPDAAGRCRRRDAVAALLGGSLVNAAAVARAGDAAKVALVHRRLRSSGSSTGVGSVAGSVAAEHVVSTTSFGFATVVAGAAAGVHPAAVGLAAVIGLGGLAIVLLTGLVAPRPVRVRGGVRGRLLAAAASAWAGLHVGHRASMGGAGGRIWVSAVLQWVFAALAIACCLTAFGVRCGAGECVTVLMGLTLAHALPVTPGGIGVNQAAAMLPLTAIYGVPAEAALAAVVAVGATELAASLAAGPPSLAWAARAGRPPALRHEPACPPDGADRGAAAATASPVTGGAPA